MRCGFNLRGTVLDEPCVLYSSSSSRPDGRGVVFSASRKVRAPQGGVLGNAKAGRPDGKWHRKHTADGVASAAHR